MSSQFRSGMWAKDVIKDKGLEGNVTGSRFINIQTVQPDGRIEGVKLYELDTDFHMARMITAKSGLYEGNHQWVLNEVVQSDFTGGRDRKITEPVKTVKTAQMKLVSEVTPEILSVLFADPDRMSAYDLLAYTKHLEANNQRTDRYEIAFWKKIVYPLSIFVMLALALPFAYLHFRAGGVSLKIFTGIMIGVCFQLINSLFSHLGLLNTWPAFVTAALPSLLFMALAIGALWWVERT